MYATIFLRKVVPISLLSNYDQFKFLLVFVNYNLKTILVNSLFVAVWLLSDSVPCLVRDWIC